MGIKLLLADDSITIQKVVGIIFASEDYDLTLVDNGDAALAKARELVPDVFLVDALMPGKNGYEVCAEVRRDPVLKDIPLLLLTGAFEPFDEDRARNCGADDIITKPFESQQLIEKVESLLQMGRDRVTAAPSAVPEPAPAVTTPEIAETEAWDTGDSALAATETVWNDESVTQGMGLWDDLADATDLPPMAEESVPSDEMFAVETPSAVPSQNESIIQEDAFSFSEPATIPQPASMPEPPVAVAQPAPVVDTVEALPEDDLWGAFVLEDEVSEEPVHFGEVIEPSPEEFTGEIEEIEPLPLAEDDLEEMEPSVEPQGFGSYEEEFSFADEEPAFAEVTSDHVMTEPPVTVEEAAAPVADTFSFESLQDVAEAPVQQVAAPEEVFAPKEEYVPAAVATPPAAAAVAAAAEPVISEEQLVAALSRLSRDVIEKIVWEVVPDLAETLIREELRKIREQG